MKDELKHIDELEEKFHREHRSVKDLGIWIILVGMIVSLLFYLYVEDNWWKILIITLLIVVVVLFWHV
jgi:membrane protein YdbS with pleckstrin-like domain